MNVYSIKIFEAHKKNGTQVIANSPKEALEQVKKIKGISKDKPVLWKWKKNFLKNFQKTLDKSIQMCYNNYSK